MGSPRVRVLYLIDSLTPGGAERSLLEMAPLLLPHGIDLDVAYLFERPGLGPAFSEAGIRTVHLGQHNSRASQVRAFVHLVRELQPDLVHTTLFESDIVGRLGARLAGVPVVSSLVNTAYDSVHLSDPAISRPRLRMAQLADAATCRLTCQLHAVSQSVANEMSRRLMLGRRTPTVVYRGRASASFPQLDQAEIKRVRDSLDLAPQTRMILSVGRQDHQKGFDTALRAVAAMRKTCPDVAYVIAGKTGAASTALHDLVRDLDLHSTVSFLGHRTDVPELMAAASAFLFPSRREGLGGAVIEAMGSRLPIVCSDIPVLREVTSGTEGSIALLVRPNDHLAFSDALQTVLSDPQSTAARVEQGQSLFLDRFEIERVARQMALFYVSALG